MIKYRGSTSGAPTKDNAVEAMRTMIKDVVGPSDAALDFVMLFGSLAIGAPTRLSPNLVDVGAPGEVQRVRYTSHAQMRYTGARTNLSNG